MPDTLKPQDLTAEERALWDAIMVREQAYIGLVYECPYSKVNRWAEKCILARRKLYGEPEEAKECPHCEEMCAERDLRDEQIQRAAVALGMDGEWVGAVDLGELLIERCGEVVATHGEKSACPNCDESGVDHYDQRGFYSCHRSEQPAPPPAPVAPKGMAGVCFSIDGARWHEPGKCPHCTSAPVPYVCPNCDKQTATKQEHEIPIRDTGLCRFSCTPAPVASERKTVNEAVAERHPDLYPWRKPHALERDSAIKEAVAGELAEASTSEANGYTLEWPCNPPILDLPKEVREAATSLRMAKLVAIRGGRHIDARGHSDAADALEAWARSQAQPVVGMTPELELVTKAACAYKLSLHSAQSDDYVDRLNDAINTVRAQAAKAQSVPWESLLVMMGFAGGYEPIDQHMVVVDSWMKANGYDRYLAAVEGGR